MSESPLNYNDNNLGDVSIRTDGDVSGVTLVKDTLGVIFLGLAVLFLIVALARSQARTHELIEKWLEQQPRHMA